MLYPEKMTYINIASSNEHLESAINVLYDLNLMHIDEYEPEKQDELGVGKPLKDAEQVSELLVDLAFIKNNIALPATKETKNISLGQAQQIIKETKNRVLKISDEIRRHEERAKRMQKEIEDLTFLKDVGIEESNILVDMEQVGFLAGCVTSPRRLEQQLSGFQYEIFYQHKHDDQYPVMLFAKKTILEKIKSQLSADFIPYPLEIKETKHVQTELVLLHKKQKKEKEAIANCEHSFALVDSSAADLQSCETLLKERIKKSEVPLKCAVGEQSFVVAGWIPSNDVPKLQNKLQTIPHLYFTAEEDHESGPTKLKNPNGIQSFEFFLNMYSLPRINEIDPTFLIFISFPLFYGMMLGDIGYGLVLLILFTVLRMKLPQYRGMFDIIILSSLCTIAFGYLFGEFFGAEEFMGLQFMPYLHRLRDITELIQVSILFGIAHLNIGILFGFINEYRHHGIVQALVAKGSWFLLEVAGISLIFQFFFKTIILDSTIAGVIGLVALVMLYRGEGVAGVIEIPGLISNALSYARLAAVGLASASLALVVNSMSGTLIATGGFGMVMGLIVILIGHTVNLMLGLMDAFLQSLRLHYVEMFSKFYGGNGKPYIPFGK
ncbi:MAG: V-type ATP synthase subunit I [Candidatus Aenigmarchaeota archaeon]|nr:V-type ATP synthase subunit I [Candidatus Aenigmarchaeota archaeon]